MSELNSLLEGDLASLDDLVSVPVPTDKPIINQVTANNLAAHSALLVDAENAVPTYQTIMQELGGNLPSSTMDDIIVQANNRENKLAISSMTDVLSDENIPLDKKLQIASQWQGGLLKTERERSPEELLQVNSLDKEGKVIDNAEVDETRWDLAPYLQEVNSYNDEVQRMINQSEFAKSPGGLTSVINFAETVLPFLEGAAVAKVQTALRDYEGEGSVSKAAGIIRSIGLLGESKEQIKDFISSVPIDKRYEVAKAVYDMVIESDGTILGGKNSMIIMDGLRNYLVEGHYGFGDRVVDDITSMLDVVGLGSLARGAKTGLKSVANSAQFTRRAPKSVASTLAEVNDKSFNEVLKNAVDDPTGEIAKVAFGSSKEDAVINAVGPEIGLPNGAVRSKPIVDDVEFNPDMDVVDAIAGGKGNIQFTDAEKASKVEKVTEDFLNPDVTGVVARKEMTTVTAVDDGVNVRTIYGPAEGGFKDAQTAMNQVRLATRKYGVLDEELSLMKRGRDGTYQPIDISSPNAKRPGNYIVGINHTSKYDPSDTIAWGVTSVEGKFLGVPLNIFDKFPAMLKGKGGSITQHLIPSSAYIDPLLTRSAAVATDQSARGVDLLMAKANNYASMFKKLDGVNQKKFDNYIIEANQKSLKFDVNKLKADGFSDDLIETIREWKSTQDTLYVLENIDLVRQSKRKGYGLFVTKDGGDHTLVRPMTPQAAGKVTKAYDSELGAIRTITAEEKTKLYEAGGEIGAARTPVRVGDESVAYVIIKNNDHNHLRALRETDKLLNYRDGHFTIYYKDPIFITQTVKNADGTEYQKAIATAGTTKDADAHIERLRAANPDGVFDRRGDLKGEEFEEMMWNSRVNAGRTAQRTRGKTLADSTTNPTDMEFRHIDSPEESVVRAIQSISGRINMKEFLDTAKARFTEQYEDYLPRNPETFQRMWPSDVTQLVRPKGQAADLGDFSDALSTYRYIDQMENGFINLLDDASKNFFKTMAETSGQKGWGWLEKGATAAAETSPTAWARKKAFRLMLAANPLRQLPVQASQALPVILGTNPTYIAKLPGQFALLNLIDRGGTAVDAVKGWGTKLTGLSVDEAKALEKAYNESGIRSAVSAHSLIRDDIKSLVNRGPLQKVKSVAGKPIDVAQKYGFELGENVLMKSIWLSEYDVLRRSGAKIDSAALSNLHARVRALTLDMNKAGELAYNENMFSAAMQFLQAPHKAFSQILMGHRGLSKADRAKLGTSYLLTYGVGYGFLYDQASKLIDPSDTATLEIVSGGLFNLALNKTLSTIYGKEVDVDFSSSMRLLEVPNLLTVAESMASLNMDEILKASPSIAMAYGDNGKFGQLMRSIGRLYSVPEDDGNLKDVGVNFLNMFSGMSNFFKARYIMQKGYSISTKGEVVDSEVNPVEAMMRVAGFATVEEMMNYSMNDKTYYSSQKFKKDVKTLLDETSRRVAREGIDENELDYSIRMYQEANRVWGKNAFAMEEVGKQIRMRAKTGDFQLFNRLLDMSKTASEEEMRQAIIRAPMSEENRKNLMSIIDTIKVQE